jgi:hypothetical protein
MLQKLKKNHGTCGPKNIQDTHVIKEWLHVRVHFLPSADYKVVCRPWNPYLTQPPDFIEIGYFKVAYELWHICWLMTHDIDISAKCVSWHKCDTHDVCHTVSQCDTMTQKNASFCQMKIEIDVTYFELWHVCDTESQ